CSALHPLSLLAPASTDLYTLPLHDALPISLSGRRRELHQLLQREPAGRRERQAWQLGLGAASGRGLQAEPELVPERRPQEGADPDRKSTRLNSSHVKISYAVFCLKKKKKNK